MARLVCAVVLLARYLGYRSLWLATWRLKILGRWGDAVVSSDAMIAVLAHWRCVRLMGGRLPCSLVERNEVLIRVELVMWLL